MGEKNKYASYKQMIDHEKENTDYKIVERYGTSETAIIAIHGGGIEAGTTEVAGAIAGEDYSFYSFLGIKSKGNWDLHLDSRVFMERRCLVMVNKADQVVSIHGCEIEKAEAEGDIFLGGRDDKLRDCIAKHLSLAEFWVGNTPLRIAARDEINICNRTRTEKGGVQIEIQAALRAQMFKGNYKKRNDRTRTTKVLGKFVAAVRAAIEESNQN